MALNHLIYLHGFRSSSRSAKAQRMAQWATEIKRQGLDLEWLCPDLPPSPAQATDLIDRLTAHWPPHQMAVMGSSLGGFYAAWLGAKRHCKAVLLNPAVAPARDLMGHLGMQTAWHDDAIQFEFTVQHVNELAHLVVGPGTACPDTTDLLSVIATGDEVLDWQEMVSRYGQGRVHLIQGSDHALSDFEVHLPIVEAFLLDFPDA